MTENRSYVCTSCGDRVRAIAFTMGAYPNGFNVGCDCISMDACPYEMSQAETPDEWRIERPDCCADVDVKELETVYGGGVDDYACPDCGARYRWDGTMSTFPGYEDAGDDETDPGPNQQLTEVES